MRGVNKVILIGRLGKDPEVRRIDPNTTKASFPLATSEAYKNQEGQWIETTDWHNIVMWRGIAERAERELKKGNAVYIEGKLKTRSWDDKDGHKRYTTEIVVENFQTLIRNEDQRASNENGHANDGATASEMVENAPDFDGGLPF